MDGRVGNARIRVSGSTTEKEGIVHLPYQGQRAIKTRCLKLP